MTKSSSFYVPPDGLDTAEKRLQHIIENKYGVQFASYQEFHRWSCDNYDKFWEEVLLFTNMKLSSPYTSVIDKSKSIASIPKWFPGAKLNYAENCLRGESSSVAFVSAHSATEYTYHTHGELKRDVERLATALRNSDIGKDDTVCGFLPNTYETAVAMLATTAIGAAWCSASTDFGVDGILCRFKQVSPKILFVVEGVVYKDVRGLHEQINGITAELPSLQHIILFEHLKSAAYKKEFSPLVKEKLIRYNDFVAGYSVNGTPFQYEQVEFHHPLFIMFSSGTTGAPKAMVHTVGGTLIKHIEEHIIQEDVRPTDRMLFFTTCGWMMWNWLMSILYTGASAVLYDGSPIAPHVHILLQIAGKTESTIIGMGARMYDEYTKMADDFKSLYNLKVKMVLSTASPLKASTFEFINNHIAPQAVIGSISGGTDILGCFMGCSKSLAVHAGECQCLYLGMDMFAYNRQGQPVYDERGELVCLTPFPSMPVRFLHDPDGSKYRKAYFSDYEGAWAHGDYCIFNSKTGGIVMLGRSDTTLNRGGVRFGTAEVYMIVESFESVDDSIAVGQKIPGKEDERILLFLKMKAEHQLTDTLKTEINTALRTRVSFKHYMDAIHAVEDIPYTQSGKKSEAAVKKVVNGDMPDNIASFRNPESVDCYKSFALSGTK